MYTIMEVSRLLKVMRTVTVGAEMLAGDSVVPGWDPIERVGPKDDRQVTDLWIGVMKDKELKLEETEVSHTVGGSIKFT